MKKLALVSLLLCVGVFYAYGASGKKSLPNTFDFRTAKVTNTYANSQVDTVIYNCPAGLNALAFAMHFKDSASVTSCVIRRVVDGALMAAIASDTVAAMAAFASTVDGSSGSTTFSDGKSVTGAITLAPLCDTFLFIVTYAGSANGVTTPTVVYEAIQQLTKKP